MNAEDARIVLAWRYDGIYAAYNMLSDEINDTGGLEEMLDRRSPYYAVRNEQGELVGFFCVGSSAMVWDSEPGIYTDNSTVTIGLGLRPDMTGKGLGQEFVNACLAFAQQKFTPEYFRLFVYTWNERAISIYERAGFQRMRVFIQSNMYGKNEFLEMSRSRVLA